MFEHLSEFERTRLEEVAGVTVSHREEIEEEICTLEDTLYEYMEGSLKDAVEAPTKIVESLMRLREIEADEAERLTGSCLASQTNEAMNRMLERLASMNSWKKELPTVTGLYLFSDGKRLYHARVTVFPPTEQGVIIIRSTEGMGIIEKDEHREGWWLHLNVQIPKLPS